MDRTPGAAVPDLNASRPAVPGHRKDEGTSLPAAPSRPRPDPAGPRPPAPAEPRQRWRIVFARDEPDDRTHRDIADAWTSALVASGIPLARGEGRPRPPLAFAAPLPVGVVAREELADLVLAARLPLPDVRATVESTLPHGLRLVDLYDVWLGAPALAAAVVAADWRVELDGEPDRPTLVRACANVLEARELVRERPRGGSAVRYDLRPLLAEVALESDVPPVLRVRTRFHPERGAGRPEEVVAAVGEQVGRPLDIRRTVRERLVLAGDG